MASPVFDNAYARLPERFYTRLDPTPVPEPKLFALNDILAADLGMEADWLSSKAGVAMLSGNAMPDGADPIAQVYAGHQFGGWSPRLGDGRAHLLGEVIDVDGGHWDLQLKGSGQTPYSRMGDGRAWLGPVIREYIVSEAMNALSVPTTRALAAVTTGEDILREDGYLPGAVLTRAAPSHLRVGTFQYFASIEDNDALAILLSFAISRHYPDLETDDALGFLDAVTRAQANLVAKWMGLGFIHGVMNTDNTHIGGITIDYGPCAFLDAFHPAKVFSSIDQFGRYAYGAQPQILVWNLAQLATSLLPLINVDADKGVNAAEAVLHRYGEHYTQAWKAVFFPKIGLPSDSDGDIALVQDLLSRMAENQADFTRTFRAIATGGPARDEFVDPTAFDAWELKWKEQIKTPDLDAMARHNPAFIPRNHRIEQAITEARAGDRSLFDRLNRVLAAPYEDQPEHADLQDPPTEQELVTRTFCGT